MKRIPTVGFDTSRLTHTVLADLEHNIRKLPETTEQNFDQLYDLAMRAFAAGGDLYTLSTGIMALNIDGLTAQRASQIATHLWIRAQGMMDRETSAKVGITHALWMYSNAPCMSDPKAPTPNDLRRDKAHKAANGRKYVIADGLVLDGKRMWPGYEDACRCSTRPLVPGFEV